MVLSNEVETQTDPDMQVFAILDDLQEEFCNIMASLKIRQDSEHMITRKSLEEFKI